MLRSVRQLLWTLPRASRPSDRLRLLTDRVMQALLEMLQQGFRHESRARRRSRWQITAVEVGLWSAEELEDRALLAAPEYDQASYFFDVSEDATAGSIGSVVATDPDAPDGGGVTYSGGADPFSVNPANGEISFTGSLDFEAQQSYSFQVIATDADSETTPVTVDVYLTDVDDTAPVFAAGSAISVAEDALTGDWVETLSALDPDTNGADLTYSIITDPNAPTPPFAIGFSYGYPPDGTGSANGYADLVVDGVLDYETTASYTFTVKVEDPGGRSSTIAVTVGVSDADDMPPVFASDVYSATISEDAAGTPVATVQATDPDTAAAGLSYSISGGNDDGLFEIDATSGQISLMGDPDHETAPTYELTVKVSDGTREDTATVNVTVTDVDDEFPVLGQENYSLELAENTAVPSTVLTLGASDADTPAESLTYTLLSGGGPFELSTSGQLTLTSALDYESESLYSLQVEVRDAGEQTDTAWVDITITAINEAPEFDRPDDPDTYVFDVPQEAFGYIGPWTNGGQLFATDPEGDTLTYTGEPEYPLSVESDGRIKILGNSTYVPLLTPGATYNFQVSVTDPSGQADTATVTINVSGTTSGIIARDDHVEDTTSSNADGDPVYEIDVLGNDSQAPGGNPVYFYIDANYSQPEHGTVAFANGGRSFVYTPDDGFVGTDHFDYRAYDFGTEGYSDYAEVTIEVGPNEPPELDDSYSFFVRYFSAQDDDMVGQITAQDNDDLQYSEGSSTFQIDASTGELFIESMATLDDAHTYHFTVTADDGEYTDTANVTIRTSGRAKFNETATHEGGTFGTWTRIPAGIVLAELPYTQPDPQDDGQVQASFTTTTWEAIGQSFRDLSNVVDLVVLDDVVQLVTAHEIGASVLDGMANVFITDPDGGGDDLRVHFNVIDVTDGLPPEFVDLLPEDTLNNLPERYEAYVVHENVNNDLIGQVVIEDPDSDNGDVVSFTIDDPALAGMLSISSVSLTDQRAIAEVRVTDAAALIAYLEANGPSIDSLTIRVTDADGMQAFAALRITLVSNPENMFDSLVDDHIQNWHDRVSTYSEVTRDRAIQIVDNHYETIIDSIENFRARQNDLTNLVWALSWVAGPVPGGVLAIAVVGLNIADGIIAEQQINDYEQIRDEIKDGIQDAYHNELINYIDSRAASERARWNAKVTQLTADFPNDPAALAREMQQYLVKLQTVELPLIEKTAPSSETLWAEMQDQLSPLP